ncbi:glycosyltransferase family 39 protein [Isoptericola sp. 4D.3]|uniref:Glycosyltransferase family 39 protein n=1 Tax=Isoptericola peretonis TaxID=2918523 RepID=A0ABT0J677_9MICO|nr:glycosyltransferase family 39 protein [Isoptericola sp. 4D.3]
MTETTPHVRQDPAPTSPASAVRRAPRSGLRGYRRALVVLTLAVAAWGAVWAVVTPPFQAPDEQNHLNSALRIAHGGGWPAPGDAYFSPGVVEAVEEAAYHSDPPGRWTYRPDARQFVDVEPVPRDERAHIDAATALGDASSGTDVDQMTQHPPLYYALAAGVLRVSGLDDDRWDVQMLALRLFDVLLLALTVPLAAETARRITRSTSAGLIAAVFPLFLPQLGHIMGAVNNDALVMLACAGATYLAARVVTGDLRWRVAVAIGLVLGLGLLTKVMVAFAVPTVVVAYLLARGRSWPARLGRVVVAGVVAGVVGGWWWVRNVITLGAVQPVGILREPETYAQVPDSEVVSTIVEKLAQAFFGNLGWLEVRLPGAWVVAGTMVLMAAGLAALALPGARRASAALLLLPAGLAFGVAYNAWDFHQFSGGIVAVQGRYVFGGVTALAAVFAVAVWQLVGRHRRRTAWAVPLVVVLTLAAGVGGLAWAFASFYRGPGESVGDAVDRWLAWSPVEAPALIAVLVLAVTAWVSALVVGALWPRRLAAPASLDATAGTAPPAAVVPSASPVPTVPTVPSEAPRPVKDAR